MLRDRKLLAYFGHHKCATVWIHNIMAEVCQVLGLKIANLHSPAQFQKNLPAYIRDNAINTLTYANADRKYVDQLNEFIGFHLIRDPRDLAVSSYFSHLYSHPIKGWPELRAHREQLQQIPKTQGLIKDMEFIQQGVFTRMAEWDYGQKNVLEVKMEALAREPQLGFQQIFKFLCILKEGKYPFFSKGLTPQKLKKILQNKSFTRLSGGRKPGQEDHKHHFRKGTPGDWKNHFDQEAKQYFKETYTPLLIKLGYETDDNW